MSRGLGYLERKIYDLILSPTALSHIRSTTQIARLVPSKYIYNSGDENPSKSHINSIHRALSNLETKGLLLRTSRLAFGEVYWGSPKSVWIYRLRSYLDLNWGDLAPDPEPFINDNPGMKLVWNKMSELERNRYRRRDSASLIYSK
jgi:hypothetical protein